LVVLASWAGHRPMAASPPWKSASMEIRWRWCRARLLSSARRLLTSRPVRRPSSTRTRRFGAAFRSAPDHPRVQVNSTYLVRQRWMGAAPAGQPLRAFTTCEQITAAQIRPTTRLPPAAGVWNSSVMIPSRFVLSYAVSKGCADGGVSEELGEGEVLWRSRAGRARRVRCRSSLRATASIAPGPSPLGSSVP
jgi:hypothetical protein